MIKVLGNNNKPKINANSDSRFLRKSIPSNFVGKKYGELFDHYRDRNGALLIGLFYEDENIGIGSILSSDTSSLDKFIEQKLKEGGISLQEQSKVHINVNPSLDYIIKEGERALLIPWGNYEKWTTKKLQNFWKFNR